MTTKVLRKNGHIAAHDGIGACRICGEDDFSQKCMGKPTKEQILKSTDKFFEEMQEFVMPIVCPTCLKDMESCLPRGVPKDYYMWVHCCTADEYACPASEGIERFATGRRKGETTMSTQDMFLPVQAWHNDDEWIFMKCGHPKSKRWKGGKCSWCVDERKEFFEETANAVAQLMD